MYMNVYIHIYIYIHTYMCVCINVWMPTSWGMLAAEMRLLRRFPCGGSYCWICYTYTQVCINVDYRHRPNSLYLVQQSKSGRARERAREMEVSSSPLITNSSHLSFWSSCQRTNSNLSEISRDFGRWNLLSLPHTFVVRTVCSSPSSRSEITPKVRWHDDNLEQDIGIRQRVEEKTRTARGKAVLVWGASCAGLCLCVKQRPVRNAARHPPAPHGVRKRPPGRHRGVVRTAGNACQWRAMPRRCCAGPHWSGRPAFAHASAPRRLAPGRWRALARWQRSWPREWYHDAHACACACKWHAPECLDVTGEGERASQNPTPVCVARGQFPCPTSLRPSLLSQESDSPSLVPIRLPQHINETFLCYSLDLFTRKYANGAK